MKLLVTGALKCDSNDISLLESIGHTIVFMQDEKGSVPCKAEEIEGVICNGLFLYHDITQFKKLRYIQLTSAGFDRVPMQYVSEHNIDIFNANGVYSIPMAEFAISGVLQLYKQSRFFCDNQKKRRWEKYRGLIELYQKNICIVGCGSVGNECAKRFKSFGCNVVGVDIKPYQSTLYSIMLPLDSLDDALNRADVVILSLPLTEETRYLINADRFSSMKQGCVLVNIARGTIVDTEAMIEALSTTLGGAVLDVFESEPLEENSPLWSMENVILTPHNSFVGEGNTGRLREVIIENLRSKNEI